MYGTRGSIPVTGADYKEFGGDTTCLQIENTDTGNIAIIDAGTGIRRLGKDFYAQGRSQEEIFIGFTHFHWDHIQGFPFFGPAYDPKQTIKILAMGKGREVTDLKGIFSTQMQSTYFPVPLDGMGADFVFILDNRETALYEDQSKTSSTMISARPHRHPGDAYSIRLENKGKVVVFVTDIEHGDQVDERVVELCKGADLLIHEAQYTTEELEKYKGWGHSSFDQAIEVAERAGVKRLVMTHHDPDHDDEFLRKQEKICQARYKDCELARDKMVIEV